MYFIRITNKKKSEVGALMKYFAKITEVVNKLGKQNVTYEKDIRAKYAATAHFRGMTR